jgi:hypothetical protein
MQVRINEAFAPHPAAGCDHLARLLSELIADAFTRLNLNPRASRA